MAGLSEQELLKDGRADALEGRQQSNRRQLRFAACPEVPGGYLGLGFGMGMME